MTARFGFILQIFDDATDDFSRSDFQGDFQSRLHELLIIATVERHSSNPKVLEEFRHHFGTNVLGFHAIRGDALFDNL